MNSSVNLNVLNSMPLCFYFSVLVISALMSKSLATSTTDDTTIGKCGFKSYLDIKKLKEERERILPLVDKRFTARTSGKNESYEYTVGICRSASDENTDAAVIQRTLNENNIPNSEFRVTGKLSETHMMLGTDWILLEYQGGDDYSSHCGKESRRSLLMITCDEEADDASILIKLLMLFLCPIGLAEPSLFLLLRVLLKIFVEEENSKRDDCFYLFEIKHKAVCPVPAGGSGLSVGSILVIVFFSVLFVYIVVGFLYQRFVLRSKGIEQFPNYEFWKDFGNLQADGCDLVCRTKDRRRIEGFGGLGDDQLDPTEEIRDENLLPM
ncbi:cation-dependent mannose-6-phosphate receptor-like isoform X1 [Biomphalaria pfeifferi]|uniref:Cation-dependent mannose-6-phosphate receptor-like isoform X1 n=1 Tax=Biomphalaria pfeifferi TaxID=112525 RepID=A0AAD8FF67_BIOPF|nr:cation-dependent mannose-6-phosphate receptor-like isoform X1 [Biomphalaria pfeifferi]